MDNNEAKESATLSDGTDSSQWLNEIKYARRKESKWRGRGDKVIERYRAEKNSGGHKFNILWSNTETIKPALYANTAQPDVRRRFPDKNPVGKQAAKIMERALSFSIDIYDFDDVIERVIEDDLLPGRGNARVIYKPTFGEPYHPREPVEPTEILQGDDMMPYPIYPDDTLFTEDGQAYVVSEEEVQDVVYEEAYIEYVHWKDFVASSETVWEKKRWIAFRNMVSKEDAIEQFGREKALLLKYDKKQDGTAYEETNSENEDYPDSMMAAEVWEIWNRPDRTVYVVSMGCPVIIEKKDDPLSLEGFFPCPKPLQSHGTNDSTIPIPEFTLYQDQADELDDITGRIDKLTDALKRRGVYDASLKELSKLADAEDNVFIPVDNWVDLMNKGGIDQVIQEADITNLANIIVHLHNNRESIKQTIYELTGISDIIRGASDPRETATAQQIKGQFGTMRLQNRQRSVQKYIRDILRIKAEVIVEQFEPEQLSIMTNTEIMPEVIQMIQDDKMRGFAVDVETDSTVATDAIAEQKTRVEFLQAITGFMEKVMPAVAQGMMPQEVAKEMLLFAVRSFKVGSELEDVLDQMVGDEGEQDPAKMQAQLMQAKQQIEQMTEMGKQMQAKIQELEGGDQKEMAKTQMKTSSDEQIAKYRADSDRSTKVMIAQMNDNTNKMVAAMNQPQLEVNGMTSEMQSIISTMQSLAEAVQQNQNDVQLLSESVAQAQAERQQIQTAILGQLEGRGGKGADIAAQIKSATIQ